MRTILRSILTWAKGPGLNLVTATLLIVTIIGGAQLMGLTEAHAETKPVSMGVVPSNCSAKAYANWRVLGDYLLAATIYYEKEQETSYQDVAGTQSLELEVKVAQGARAKVIFEAVDKATGVVDETSPDVEVNCSKGQTVNVYTTPGDHTVNGRQWRTTCGQYSSTVNRCFTYIWATQVTKVNGQHVQKTDWVFNNLTYLPSPRASWQGNPLSYNYRWVSEDGRFWLTECDTPRTGRNGCNSYIETVVIELDSNGRYVEKKKMVFNNKVLFDASVLPS